MTRKVNFFAKCRKCDVDAVCPKCGQAIPRSSAFSDWLRNLPPPYDSSNISNQNLDYVWHNYREDWFITIEEKMNGASCTYAQRDTHAIVYSLLKIASGLLEITKGFVWSTMREEWKRIEYRGHYVVSFEKTNPDDSEWIRINGEIANKADLLRLLKQGNLEEPSL